MATITQGNPLLSDARVAKVRGELTVLPVNVMSLPAPL